MRETGYSKPVNIELATVISPPPQIRIRLDADGLELGSTDLIVAESLTRHYRVATIEHEEKKERDLGDGIGVDMLDTDDGLTEEDGPDYETTRYKHEYISLKFEDVLKTGDRVIVACLDEDMIYVVLDRAVFYR